MTVEEYQAALNGIVQNPETAATAALNIMEGVKKDAAERDAYKATIAEKDKTINTINAQAAQYLITQTGASPSADVESEEPPTPKTLTEILKERSEAILNGD